MNTDRRTKPPSAMRRKLGCLQFLSTTVLRQLCTDERQISGNQSHREMYRLVEAGYVDQALSLAA